MWNILYTHTHTHTHTFIWSNAKYGLLSLLYSAGYPKELVYCGMQRISMYLTNDVIQEDCLSHSVCHFWLLVILVLLVIFVTVGMNNFSEWWSSITVTYCVYCSAWVLLTDHSTSANYIIKFPGLVHNTFKVATSKKSQ